MLYIRLKNAGFENINKNKEIKVIVIFHAHSIEFLSVIKLLLRQYHFKKINISLLGSTSLWKNPSKKIWLTIKRTDAKELKSTQILPSTIVLWLIFKIN